MDVQSAQPGSRPPALAPLRDPVLTGWVFAMGGICERGIGSAIRTAVTHDEEAAGALASAAPLLRKMRNAIQSRVSVSGMEPLSHTDSSAAVEIAELLVNCVEEAEVFASKAGEEDSRISPSRLSPEALGDLDAQMRRLIRGSMEAFVLGSDIAASGGGDHVTGMRSAYSRVAHDLNSEVRVQGSVGSLLTVHALGRLVNAVAELPRWVSTLVRVQLPALDAFCS